jgi:hypothetical protein
MAKYMVHWRRWTREIDDDDGMHFDFASLHSAALGSDSTCKLDKAWHVFHDRVIDYV